MDEFIFLKNHRNIKNFLNLPKFSRCQSIRLNLFFHNDNNLLHYDNRTLSSRFVTKVKKKKVSVKSILRGNILIKIISIHNLDDNLKSCDGEGKFTDNKFFTEQPDYINNYIDHYCFKSTEEFVNKINRGDVVFGKNKEKIYQKIEQYFQLNDITLKKIDYIEKMTKLNLSKYRKALVIK